MTGSTKENYVKEYAACCVIGFIPKVIMILTAAYPLYNPGDELYLFYIPAKLAGLDWASSMSAYRYYGYGFSIFLVPLFRSIQDAVILYRVILILVAALQSVIPVICCYLLHAFFSVNKRTYIIPITAVCTYEVAVTNVYMYNEHIYIIWVWVSFFILAKLWQVGDNRGKKLVYSFLLGFSFLGALTVHQRAVTLLMAFFILYGFVWIVLKKKICYVLPVVGVYAVGNYVNTRIMDYFIRVLKYGNDLAADVSTTQNRSVKVSLSWRVLQDEDYIQAVIKTVLGNLNNWNIKTIGIGIFSLVLGISFLAILWKKRELGEEQEKLLYFGIFGMASIFITIAGLAVSWGWGVKAAYVNSDSTSDSLRGLTYLRYLYAYYPPILAGILAYIEKYPRIYVKLFRYTIMISGFLSVYYLSEIAPLTKNRTDRLGTLGVYNLQQYTFREMIPADYLIAVIIFFVILLLLYYAVERKEFRMALMMICILTGWSYIRSVYFTVGKNSQINYQYVNKYSELINVLERENIDIPIYVYAGSVKETGHGLLYELQFVNMGQKLYRGFPEEDLEEAFYFTSYPEEAEYLIENGYDYMQLDDTEYAYIKGERVIEKIEKYQLGKILKKSS